MALLSFPSMRLCRIPNVSSQQTSNAIVNQAIADFQPSTKRATNNLVTCIKCSTIEKQIDTNIRIHQPENYILTRHQTQFIPFE